MRWEGGRGTVAARTLREARTCFTQVAGTVGYRRTTRTCAQKKLRARTLGSASPPHAKRRATLGHTRRLPPPTQSRGRAPDSARAVSVSENRAPTLPGSRDSIRAPWNAALCSLTEREAQTLRIRTAAARRARHGVPRVRARAALAITCHRCTQTRTSTSAQRPPHTTEKKGALGQRQCTSPPPQRKKGRIS